MCVSLALLFQESILNQTPTLYSSMSKANPLHFDIAVPGNLVLKTNNARRMLQNKDSEIDDIYSNLYKDFRKRYYEKQNWLFDLIQAMHIIFRSLKDIGVSEIDVFGGDKIGEPIIFPCILDDICNMNGMTNDNRTINAALVEHRLRINMLDDVFNIQKFKNLFELQLPSLNITALTNRLPFANLELFNNDTVSHSFLFASPIFFLTISANRSVMFF